MKGKVLLMLNITDHNLKINFRTGCLLMAALSVARGSSFLFSKQLLGSMEPLNLLGVRFLLAVCYDLRFPVWLRSRDDYDVMLLVASWPDVRRFAWDTLARARAIENACYVAAVNRVGSDPACTYNGGTAWIGPYGETLAEVPDSEEGFACGEIDLDHLAAYHAKFPVLEDADSFDLVP